MSVSLAKPEYTAHINTVYETYKPLIEALLDQIGKRLTAHGLQVSNIVDLSTDDYQWSMVVRNPGAPNEHSVDFEVEIVEQRLHEGQGWGVSFRLGLRGWGGLVISDFAPHNYTRNWVVNSRDPEAVAARWAEFATVGDADTFEVLLHDVYEHIDSF